MLARLILPMDWTDGTAKRTGIVNPCLSGLASRARSFSPAGDPTFSILNTYRRLAVFFRDLAFKDMKLLIPGEVSSRRSR